MGVNHGGEVGRAPRIWSGDANTNCAPDFRKSTAQNSPKHAISSEKFIFFWGGDLAPTRPILVDRTPRPQPSLLDPALRPAEF